MKLPRTFLTSRVGRRMFALFILCALVPMTVLAIVSFVQVNRLISENESRTLHRNAFSQSMAVYDRLIFLDKELEMVSGHVMQDHVLTHAPLRERDEVGDGIEYHVRQYALPISRKDDLVSLHFLSLAVLDDAADTAGTIFGEPQPLPSLMRERLQPLPPDKAMVITDNKGDGSSRVFLIRQIPGRTDHPYMIAEINLAYLLGMHENGASIETVRLSILNESRILFTTLPSGHGSYLVSALLRERSTPTGFVWSAGRDRYLSSCAHIFLPSRFVGTMWTLVLSEPVEFIRAPVAMFRNTFIPVSFVALCFVLLLSIRQIRKSLIPLERLKESTGRISRGELAAHEVIKSGDEFEDLSEAFSTMAVKLDQQFNTLKTMASIDRSILSLLDSDKIVEAFLSRIENILPSEAAGVYIHDGGEDDTWHLHTRNPGKPESRQREIIEIPGVHLEPLRLYKEYIVFRQGEEVYPYLRRLSGQEMKLFLVLPIQVKQELHAFIALAKREGRGYSSDDIINARQIADHMAVAFANAGLIDELNKLNWGTLTALARVVDAKSSWTAGHSERVADLAVSIGKAAGLPEKELVVLNKAGLLHDIGKIRTPRTILDKPDKLTEEEVKIIRRHPEDSARILEPITPYRDIIPAVLQHHERFDGKGYPLGLSGEGISLLGRILAVADSFDAMVSDRPYRKGKSRDEAIKEIRREAGKQFDPEMVQALVRVVGYQGHEEEGCR